ncbi:MAG: peptidoglycan-binding domain-containing protein [Candidatus Paceibacterota bacterium]
MSNLFKSKFLLGVMVVAIMLVGVVAVGANQAAADCSITVTLRVGSVGDDVKCLQTLVGATADGKFGPMTKAAVMAWQSQKGLAADGVFGPLSRAAMGGSVASGPLCPNGMTLASNCSLAPNAQATGPLCPNGMTLASNCTTGTGTATGPLAGTAGTVTYSQLSQYSSEEVGEGVNDIKVAGFELEASDGDVSLRSFKLTFDDTGYTSGDSTRLEDYIESVSIWQGSTKIGSADAVDFTRDSTGIYSKVVAVSNAVVRDGDTEKFYITVNGANSIDSEDINSDSWTVDPINVRYEDGGGVVSTDTITQTAIPISFVTAATASDTELKITLDSALQAGVVTVNTTSDTNGVLLLKGTMKVEGDSDVWLDEVPFLFTTNATNVDGVTPTVYFSIDGEEYSESMTASAGTTEAITFNELDKTLKPGSYTFTVKADVNDIETSSFDEGDYLSAALDSTRRALIIAEANGTQLTDSTEMTGVASGTIQYFYSIAPTVTVVSKSITPNDNGSNPAVSATAKMKLAITANGGTLYLNGDDESTAAEEFFGIAVDGGDASSSVSSYTFTPSGTYTVTNGGADNEYYTLNEGDTMYVDIESVVVEATGSSAILVGMKGDEILFGTDVTSGATRSANQLNFTTLTDLLKTGKTTLDS